ncbi:3-dehydroquinate synthase [Rickettsiales endosymbiont of Stachyamoeba lipophora]|uniref:3-dehydroquinate synthase n=1 Tax=Rickettsiales endosymbiont of Stachyamoeba lipophora TaxID=2486578 RepID=UPI0013DDF724|nr:3-dehydroquinate synthase family protein [Rickettsiales endosymbiont of Stachyamoeba lipophora]
MHQLLIYNDLNSIIAYLTSINKDKHFIIDQKIVKHYPDLFEVFSNKYIITVDENIKNLNVVSSLIAQLVNGQISKDSLLIGIGGGVISDICGFIASILFRGIKLCLVPTTLLSMVDSSIGGKNSINVTNLKNIIGTIYPSHTVIICDKFLNSLDKKEISSGLAEIIKIAFTSNYSLYDKLLSKNYLTTDFNQISEIITLAIKTKLDIVNQDIQDANIRKILNFGHTIGHAIESISNFNIPHGFAVALGMLLEIKITHKLGLNKSTIEPYLENLIEKYNLTVNFDYLNFKEPIKRAIKFDKKLSDHSLSITIFNKIGEAQLHQISLDSFIDTFTGI